MEFQVQAIFENGVFKPLGKVPLQEHQRVILKIKNRDAIDANADNDDVDRQKCAMAELDAELDRLADNSPDDGLSGEDHDEILYGGGS